MNADEDDTTQAAREKARRALRSARVLLDAEDVDGTVNRAYYAAFYLASAALHLVGENPKTHSGVLDRFWVRFVQGGSFSRDKAKALHRALDARQKADYTFLSVHDVAAASELLREVEAFCDAANALLQDLPADDT